MVKYKNVNICLGLVVVFLLFCCAPTDPGPSDAANIISKPAPLQVIWGSRNIQNSIAEIGLAQNDQKYILARFDDGSLQILDFELDRINDVSMEGVDYIGDGFDFAITDDAAVLFFGIRSAQAVAILYIPALKSLSVVPIRLKETTDVLNNVTGLCGIDVTHSDVIGLGWVEGDGRDAKRRFGEISVFEDNIVVQEFRQTPPTEFTQTCQAAFEDHLTSPYGGVKLKNGRLYWVDTDTEVMIADGMSLKMLARVNDFAVRQGEIAPTLPSGAIVVVGPGDEINSSQLLLIGRQLE